ncbi:MAG: endolytic transglycosylase MltG [Oscillospiraceae bacterium]|nr:endolytic transglycosylase MltG [Oscillospiraceae bacterium]
MANHEYMNDGQEMEFEEVDIRAEESHRRSSSSRKSGSGKKTSVKTRRNRRNRQTARIYGVIIMLVLIFVISITLSVGIIQVGKDMLGLEGTETLVVFHIPEGATTMQIAELLEAKGIIRIPKAFVYFSRLSKADSGYIAGDHEVSSAMAYEEIINELSGNSIAEDQVAVNVMFPEGCTLVEAAKKLEEAKVCEASKFLYYFNAGNLGYSFEENLPKNAGLKFYRMEGYLFPDTYTFYEEMEPDAVCQKIYVNFDSKITPDMYKRMKELGFSLDEVITLASIVQREAANEEEMPKIASVFWNRLKHPAEFGGKLQSDPTTKYVDDVIRRYETLQNDQMYEAYDTYKCKGLPAGAICNPGIDAINAVLYPEKTGFYYFYADIDTKTTYFARTLEEHNKNIARANGEYVEEDEEDEEGENGEDSE